ncbi:hypothetical protein EJ05DRAFT_166672 [Pseudovirgaria hyperparasitica]|uniref:Mediator of RNA polymerase II transcription subunit 4 n=1 Tax=Pseudovirgaria hyperparasitica TaxID=470096 RepID=A0A6A6VVJ0_9PEZI|nr:uncharacterized protein EJ05DRAFT_166672 [Pseudovirgaria hyperparasitica]KAF2753640.1 hypothetical protein EJ05DRAFT_166672 [Pseudovirgaria hyperparasitica]
MEAALDAQFTRLESSLSTLIDSITAYNPLIEDAKKLMDADEGLNKELERLEQHQANHTRILALRQTAESLDNTLKSILATIAETRRELVATPVTTFPSTSRDVPFDELLSYAKFISKTTRPPTVRNAAAAAAAAPEPTTTTTTTTTAITTDDPPNGTTQSPTLPQDDQQPTQTTTLLDPTHDPTLPTNQKGLSQEMRDVLASMAAAPWEPWPSNDRIRSGNLFAIQRMLDSGLDPWQVLSAEEQAVADRARAAEEERLRRLREATAAEERARRENAYAKAQAQVQAQAHQDGGERREERKAVETFDDGGLDLYDPDED